MIIIIIFFLNVCRQDRDSILKLVIAKVIIPLVVASDSFDFYLPRNIDSGSSAITYIILYNHDVLV